MSRIEATVRQFVSQVMQNPAKHMKPNRPFIEGAIMAQLKAAGFDEDGVDYAAEFRKRIERMAERRHLYLDAGGEDEA
jgi:hypothetical protein